MARLAAAAAEAGVGDRVLMPGRMEAADVPVAMAAADAVVVASTGEEAFRSCGCGGAGGRAASDRSGHGALVETTQK